jgi:transglutaminase-like putative cysteine protease
MKKYLNCSEFIDTGHPLIIEKARELRAGDGSQEGIARRCFEFVRDEIKHSWDYRKGPVTCGAQDVLVHGTGYCYAKSHLLAALLRVNGIPAGLCYQRLLVEPGGTRYCLHGLNALYLEKYGWYRIDARGNKAGVEAEFNPPVERLAFSAEAPGERDLPVIWPEPLPLIVRALTENSTIEEVYDNFPDVEVI